MGRTDESLKGSRNERQVLLQRFEGTIIESIMVHNRSDKAIDLTVDRRYDGVKKSREVFLDNYIAKSGDADKIANIEQFKDQFRSGFEGSRGAGKTLSRFSQNICRNTIKFYTEEGDIVVDPFAGHNCLLKGTKIVTKDGLKDIEDVKEKDLVLTHKNRYRPVLGTSVNIGGEGGKKFRIAGNLPLEITDGHPMYVIQTRHCPYYNGSQGGNGRKCLGECPIRRRISNVVNSKCGEYYKGYSPDFVRADKVEVGSYWGYPIDMTIKDVEQIRVSDYIELATNCKVYDGMLISPTKGIKNDIQLTPDVMRLFGYFLAEGGSQGSLNFTFSSEKFTYVEDVLGVMYKDFGIEGDYEYDGSVLRVWFYSEPLRKMFRNLFGTGSENKKMPEWFKHLPLEKQAELFKGYFRGDGHSNTFQRVYVTTSPDLAIQFKDILLRFGIIPNMRKISPSVANSYKKTYTHIVSKHDTYYVYVSGSDINRLDDITGHDHDVVYGKKFNSFIKEGYAWYRVLNVEDIDLSKEDVYNFEVEEDNSYVLMNGIVHNSRMEATWRTNRNYYGQDLCHEFMEDNRKVREILLAEQAGKIFMKKKNVVIELSEGDSRRLPWPDNFGDFTITSPPYWDLEDYGPEEEQLGYGRNQTYEEFLHDLGLVAKENFRVLKPGAYCVWWINDFRKDGKFYDFHGDTKNLLVEAGFTYHDIIIADLGPSLRSVFLGSAFKSKIMPKRHEYGVVMRKPLK